MPGLSCLEAIQLQGSLSAFGLIDFFSDDFYSERSADDGLTDSSRELG